jgi:hypothetical protein
MFLNLFERMSGEGHMWEETNKYAYTCVRLHKKTDRREETTGKTKKILRKITYPYRLSWRTKVLYVVVSDNCGRQCFSYSIVSLMVNVMPPSVQETMSAFFGCDKMSNSLTGKFSLIGISRDYFQRQQRLAVREKT